MVRKRAWTAASTIALFASAAGCAAPRPSAPGPRVALAVGAPPAGDYRVAGLRAPLATVGAPGEGAARVLTVVATHAGGWRVDQASYDENEKAREIFTVEGKPWTGDRAELDWSLLRGRDGRLRERFTGKLLLRARDRRHVDGVVTFDELPDRRDEVVLERLEDPLAGG